jgi:hypothetical protein
MSFLTEILGLFLEREFYSGTETASSFSDCGYWVSFARSRGLGSILRRHPWGSGPINISLTPDPMLPAAPQARRLFHCHLINSARSADEPGSTLGNKWRQVLVKQRGTVSRSTSPRAGDHDVAR